MTGFDESIPVKYPMYLDANYQVTIPGYNTMTYIMTYNDIQYPVDLHDLHNDYPLAPERLEINKVANEFRISTTKENTFFNTKHKLYESLELKITKMHREFHLKNLHG